MMNAVLTRQEIEELLQTRVGELTNDEIINYSLIASVAPDAEDTGRRTSGGRWELAELDERERDSVQKTTLELSTLLACREELVRRLGDDPNGTVRRLVRDHIADPEHPDHGNAEPRSLTPEFLGALSDAEDTQPALDWVMLNAIERALLRIRPRATAELRFLDRIYLALQADVAITELATLLLAPSDASHTDWSRVAAILGADPDMLRSYLEDDEVQAVLYGGASSAGAGSQRQQGPMDAAKVIVGRVLDVGERTLEVWRNRIRRVAPFMELETATDTRRR